MNLEFDDATNDLIADAGKVFAGISPLPALAAGEPAGTWRKLADTGWAALGNEIETGELDLSAAAGLYRQAGRALLVEQFVTSGYLLSALAAHSDDTALAARLAARPGVLLDDTGLCFGVEEAADVYRLGDGCLEVADASCAAVARVADLSPGLGTVTLESPRWQRFPLDGGPELIERLTQGALLLHSAALIGCAEKLLEVTRDYTLTRVQFNVPIASFQAVRHALADVFTAVSVAWSAVLAAVADGATDRQRILVARYLAVDAGLVAARAGAQFHGGIGFAWESDVHWYLKTLLDGSQRFGAADEIAEQLGRMFLEEAC